VPGWILPKVEQVISNGKSSISEGGKGTPDAFIEFAVRAPGVTSNANITAKIQGAITATSAVVAAKLKKIMAGYKYNWETGQAFKAKAEDFKDR
jgi:hypothetical protein